MRKGQKALLALLRYWQILSPLPFLLLFSVPEASRSPCLQQGAEEQESSEWTLSMKFLGWMLSAAQCSQPPEIPQAQLQPALLLAPKFPRDSALAQRCTLNCTEIPQVCSSKTTNAFSHRHWGFFFFHVYEPLVPLCMN